MAKKEKGDRTPVSVSFSTLNHEKLQNFARISIASFDRYDKGNLFF